MDKKRIIFAIAFVFVTILFGYLLYRVFFAKKEAITPVITPEEEVITPGFPASQEGKPPIAAEKIKPGELPTAITIPTEGAVLPAAITPYALKNVIDTPVLGVDFDAAGATKFYNQADGKFYRMTKDGTTKALADEVFYNVSDVTWSPTKNESIIEYPDGSNIYYNFDTKKQITLPKHWEEFSFSPQGDKIASKSMGMAPENRWLVTSDPEGKNISLIEPMGENSKKVTIDWSPNKQIVALSRTGEALGSYRQEVLFVGLHGENFKSTIVEGRGFESTWSTEGKKLLYSVFNSNNGYKPDLWIVDAEGENIGANRKLLNLNTWSNKCTFQSERFVFCGVPKEINIGAGFEPSLSDTTPDILYKIDTTTGVKKEIPLSEAHVIKEIFVSGDGKTLYFTDKNQKGLFNIEL